MYSVETIEVTGAEPVTLEEIRAQCRVDTTDEDALLERLGRVAREHLEGQTGQLLRAQKLAITYDRFAREIVVPRSPIGSIVSIAHTDSISTTATLDPAAFRLDRPYGVPTLRASISAGCWPALYPGGEVVVTALGGYADGSSPETARHAILMLVAHLFANRGEGEAQALSELPFGVSDYLDDARLHWI